MHLVAFDNPYPPDYGGAIDIFYKLKYLAEKKIEVVLHFFVYGRSDIDPLRKFAAEIHVYPRNKKLTNFFFVRPFIVQSRRDNELLKNLSQDDLPVLFEGIHTTYFAENLKNRKKIFLRAHNLEQDYYYGLSRVETNPFKKLFFYCEHFKLKSYEKKISPLFSSIFSVNPKEAEWFSGFNSQTFWLPVFHPFEKIEIIPETINMVLFHGNLTVAENEHAVLFLWEKVMKHLPYPFYVSGKNPSGRLKRLAQNHKQFVLKPNPTDIELEQMIRKAKVHLFYSEQNTGVKLKLLHALFRGKHIVSNRTIVDHSRLEPLVHIANSPEKMREKITQLMDDPFHADEIIDKRQKILHAFYDNRKNVQKLIEHVF